VLRISGSRVQGGYVLDPINSGYAAILSSDSSGEQEPYRTKTPKCVRICGACPALGAQAQKKGGITTVCSSTVLRCLSQLAAGILL
jgi:hypothetical protein